MFVNITHKVYLSKAYSSTGVLCTYVSVCVRVCVCSSVCVCIYVYIYIYIYIYMLLHTHTKVLHTYIHLCSQLRRTLTPRFLYTLIHTYIYIHTHMQSACVAASTRFPTRALEVLFSTVENGMHMCVHMYVCMNHVCTSS